MKHYCHCIFFAHNMYWDSTLLRKWDILWLWEAPLLAQLWNYCIVQYYYQLQMNQYYHCIFFSHNMSIIANCSHCIMQKTSYLTCSLLLHIFFTFRYIQYRSSSTLFVERAMQVIFHYNSSRHRRCYTLVLYLETSMPSKDSCCNLGNFEFLSCDTVENQCPFLANEECIARLYILWWKHIVQFS